MVVFFPSYDYLADVYDLWERHGVLRELGAVKRVFREPRQSCGEQVLANFSAAANTGAVLLCVIGGKMSEGINFSDKLGRAVVVVGLPYANPKDPQLMEKMAFMDGRYGGEVRSLEFFLLLCSEPPAFFPAGSGQTYYQGLCMKAVNQSIGRAIRHRKDFAAIFLMDERYHNSSVSHQLPAWMMASFVRSNDFEDCCQRARTFFEKMTAS